MELMDALNSKLWYRTPAGEWEEALPVGNGRLGGMVYGGIKRERIQLNGTHHGPAIPPTATMPKLRAIWMRPGD